MRGMTQKWSCVVQRTRLDDGTPITVVWEHNKAEPENPETWNIVHIGVVPNKYYFGIPCQLAVEEWDEGFEAALRKNHRPMTEEDPLVQRT